MYFGSFGLFLVLLLLVSPKDILASATQQSPSASFVGQVGRTAHYIASVECKALCACTGYKLLQLMESTASDLQGFCFCDPYVNVDFSLLKPSIPDEAVAFNRTELRYQQQQPETTATFISRNGRISMHRISDNKISLTFASTTEVKVAILHANPRCPSPGLLSHVDVRLNPSVRLTCPAHVATGTKYTCTCAISGSHVKNIAMSGEKLTSDAESNTTTFTSTIGTYMRDLQYIHRGLAYNDKAAYINVQEEFDFAGTLQGFEVNLVKKGLLALIVMKPVCNGEYGRRNAHYYV